MSVWNDIGKDEHDGEGWCITLEFKKFNLIAAYVPNAGEGLKWLEYWTKEWDPDFLKYMKDLEESTGKPVILCGDLNVAH